MGAPLIFDGLTDIDMERDTGTVKFKCAQESGDWLRQANCGRFCNHWMSHQGRLNLHLIDGMMQPGLRAD